MPMSDVDPPRCGRKAQQVRTLFARFLTRVSYTCNRLPGMEFHTDPRELKGRHRAAHVSDMLPVACPPPSHCDPTSAGRLPIGSTTQKSRLCDRGPLPARMLPSTFRRRRARTLIEPDRAASKVLLELDRPSSCKRWPLHWTSHCHPTFSPSGTLVHGGTCGTRRP
jgi:hypothetical protein